MGRATKEKNAQKINKRQGTKGSLCATVIKGHLP